MIEQVRPADFDAWLQAQAARPLVLDVREPWEVHTARVRPERFDLLHGKIGVRFQFRGAAKLESAKLESDPNFSQRGYTDVANIAGGIAAWSRERDPAVPVY